MEKRNHATKNGFNLETPEPEGMYNYLSSYFATNNNQETPTDPQTATSPDPKTPKEKERNEQLKHLTETLIRDAQKAIKSDEKDSLGDEFLEEKEVYQEDKIER